MTLAPELARDTRLLLLTDAATLLLANDMRWPWLILVPIDDTVTELHQLDDASRLAFMEAVNQTSAAMQKATHCRSVNIAMLGNVVSQLHCHVVARSPGDTNWPAPVWGFGTPEPRAADPVPDFARAVRDALRSVA